MSRIPVFGLLLVALIIGAAGHTIGGMFLFTFWPYATPTAPLALYWWLGGFAVIAIAAVALTAFMVATAVRRRSPQ